MKETNRVLRLYLQAIAAFFLLLPAMTLAKSNEEPGPEFNSGQWIWALFSLVIVVVLAYWATKFLAGKFGVSQAKHLKVAESLFLGPNRHLYLLLVHNKVLLIGSSEGGISLIQEIDDPQFFEELERHGANIQNLPAGKFSGLITPVLGGLRPRGVDDPVNSDGKQRLLDGLEKIRSWKMRGRDRQ